MPLLIFPAAFCCDPEAEADLRCGLAAVFLAGASLDFLPSIRISFCPLVALRRPSYSFTAVEHRFQVSDDADRLFVANAQKNCSRRRHGFVALRINPTAGITAATASGKKCMMMKPITALQNPNHYPG